MYRHLCFFPGSRTFLGVLGISLALTSSSVEAASTRFQDDPNPPTPTSQDSRKPVIIRFADDSTMKLAVLDPEIEFNTAYGTLKIPVRAIGTIEFGLRVSDEESKAVAEAIRQLGSQKFKEREQGSNTLLRMREKGYAALKRAAKDQDSEVANRAMEVLKKLHSNISRDKLDLPQQDVITTADSKITGWIPTTTLRVLTFQFGEQTLKLADVRELRSTESSGKEEDLGEVLPDPGNLTQYNGQIGQTFRFRVTGTLNGNLWGTEKYTTDSTLGKAAVHMGILRPGKTGVVKVRIIPSPNQFVPSVRNGINSAGYGPYPAAYTLVR